MFTGLVQDVATVIAARATRSGSELTIGHALGPLSVGESMGVNGCCLTVVRVEDATGTPELPGRFCADVTHQTLGRTTLGQLRAGQRANLERSLSANDLLGGHLVTGHVDAVARVVEVETMGDDQHVRFEVPEGLHSMLAPRGSVTVNGVSLTLTDTSPTSFAITLIPHTRAVTTLGELRMGSEVNVEVDVIARYVAHALAVRTGAMSADDARETQLITTLKKAGLL